jgi:hypothetical protein
MGENTMMNLFEIAINKGELLSFALGKEDYFIPDRDYGDHSILFSWTSFILPVSVLKGNQYIKEIIVKMLKEVLLSNSLSKQQKAGNILYHLHVYYYLDNEGKLKAYNLEELNYKVEECFSNYLTSISDETKINSFKKAIELIKSRGGFS